MSTPFPRGIEVLLKKAAVDTEFRELLVDDPNQAAAAIELELEPVESAMLQSFPKEQLAAIIDQTEVPEPHRRTFLGTAAAAMLAVLVGSQTAVAQTPTSWGINPDMPRIGGSRPDFPNNTVPIRNIPAEVRQLVAETTKIPLTRVTPTMWIALNDQQLAVFRKEIYLRFNVRMPLKTLKTLRTVKLLTDYIVESLEGYEAPRPKRVERDALGSHPTEPINEKKPVNTPEK